MGRQAIMRWEDDGGAVNEEPVGSQERSEKEKSRWVCPYCGGSPRQVPVGTPSGRAYIRLCCSMRAKRLSAMADDSLSHVPTLARPKGKLKVPVGGEDVSGPSEPDERVDDCT